MGEEISKEIAVDGVDVRELYGAQNVYLEQIRALHPALKIVARGSSLKVLGAKSAAERFERRMQGLIDYYRGNKLVLINKSTTPMDGRADLLIQAGLGEVFSQIR